MKQKVSGQGAIPSVEKLRKMSAAIIAGELSGRALALMFNVAPSSISRLKHKLLIAGLVTLSGLDKLSDLELAQLLYHHIHKVERDPRNLTLKVKKQRKHKFQPEVLLPDYKKTAQEMLDRQSKKNIMFIEYCALCNEEHKDHVSKATFYEHLNRQIKELVGPKVFMRQYHPYGYELQIDWCHKRFPICDPISGLESLYYVFVAAWPASCYTYAEFVPSLTTQSVCNSIRNALLFFKCKPITVTIDNAAAMVVKHAQGRDALLNHDFEDFAARLKLEINANNPGAPREKSQIEKTVGLLEQRCLPLLTPKLALSVREYNLKLQESVDKYINRCGFRDEGKGLGTPRIELFLKYEKPKATPVDSFLPSYAESYLMLKVKNDYTVNVRGHDYSVPFKLAGKYVNARIEGSVLNILYDEQTVAVHRVSNSDKPSILLEHMPDNHKAVAKSAMYHSPEDVYAAAKNLSSALYDFCRELFAKFAWNNKRRFAIFLINIYVKEFRKRDLYDTALNILCGYDERKWNSYKLNEILSTLESSAPPKNINLSNSLSDEDYCLRGADSFSFGKKEHEKMEN